MNPHTPPPPEGHDPSERPADHPSDRPSGGPDASGSPSEGPSGIPAAPAAGEPLPEAPPLYPPGGPAGPGTLPPPPYYGPMPPLAGPQPQNFFDWIRSHGIHRGRERWIGGVASGIAQRLGVDPLIVRGVLIVLTVFAGVGVLLYGLAWALLPEPDGRIHVQEAAAGRWTSGMTGALITTVIGFPSLGSGVWGWDRYGFGAFVWTVFWVGGAIYVVYYLSQRNKARNGTAPLSVHHRPGGPVDRGNAANTATFAGAAGADPAGGSTQHGYPQGGYPQDPGPVWGPPPPARPRNLGPGTPAVAVTVGLALLVGGGIKALDAARLIDLGNSSNAVVWASGAAVLGLGILFAGLRGRTSGILGFFAVVALIIGGIFNVVPNGDRFRLQNADWTPSSIEQARNGFDITGGTGTADLTTLALNPPLGTDVVVPIDATASNLTVVIPITVPVHIEADMTMGNLNEGSGNRGGVTTQQSDYNTGKPGARLILRISGTMSNVTIKEGN
ncbi:PspC domain-containing protein [Arthrobacter sp. PAMC25564]|uniref:PspC domain-containing protein n=1 Tax=Arthrobacter sp. PAMC25564 TaxID=2565366 RepID=UPI0010A26AC2|nr:PspC domain-containing protein [Arthrobacter sp. PAMC25564]QCB96696.1 PspC domain-containing protein [Arthrobacter sp. PAMC25564]